MARKLVAALTFTLALIPGVQAVDDCILCIGEPPYQRCFPPGCDEPPVALHKP